MLYEADYSQIELTKERWGTLKKAVVAAAKKGHVDVVKYLLPKVTDPDPYSGKPERCWVVWEVFMEAAGNGHVEVVRFMVGFEKIKRHMGLYAGTALFRVIAGRHTDVVDFMLETPGFSWDMPDAFEVALASEQKDTAEKIYGIYPQFKKDLNLFVDLAEKGYTSAVAYLYNSGRDDSKLVGDAFTSAAGGGRVEVVKFLHDRTPFVGHFWQGL